MPTLQEALHTALRHFRAGQFQQAEQIYRQVLQVAPNHPEALHLLGLIVHQQGRHADAIQLIDRAIQANPRQPYYHNNLAQVYMKLGKLPEAIACYQRALECQPDLAEVHNNLGVAWKQQFRPDEAIACFQRAIQLKPAFVEAHVNLGNILKDLGHPDKAVDCYQQALQFNPDRAEAHNSLGSAWTEQGRLDEGIACLRRAVELKPDYAEAHNNLLYTLHYRPGTTLAELGAAHAEFDRRHAAAFRAAWRPHNNSPDADRPLRLGFVSPDFGFHPVGYFLVRVLENLDPEQCKTFCYSDRTAVDGMTSRLEADATLWRSAVGMPDALLAEQIRADRIDILFDLAGHTAGNRLLVFARKPAPIQITWLGYVGTTGLAAMDYLLADRYEVPRAAEPHYAEKVLRMPHDYVCYDPPDDAPPVGPLPALGAGHVTFGSFNNPIKITPQVVACWARILHRLPQSRLLLKFRGLDKAATQSRFRQWFAEAGIAPERLDLRGSSPHAEFMAAYHQADVVLDTFPYNGGLTTCEALWMGVPVVTCPGETFAGRHSLTHLSNAGFTETIARDLDEYVELAVRLAEDLPRLAALRSGLREQVARSPLCDGKRFAADFLAILRGVWRQWAGTLATRDSGGA